MHLSDVVRLRYIQSQARRTLMKESSDKERRLVNLDGDFSALAQDTVLQQKLLSSLKVATEKALPAARKTLSNLLSPLEREVQTYVDSLHFADGTWYRPIHNVIVPLAMIAICNAEEAERDLVIAAQLHDIGYSAISLPSLLQGARLELKNAREAHMHASKIMSDEFLTKLTKEGRLSLSPTRKQQLLEIIATHDYPYIGKQLSDREALLHRDADRCFVLSCVSFWKDYLALISDTEVVANCSSAHVQASPLTLLEARRTSFLLCDSKVVPGLNESSTEPVFSAIAETIVEGMSARREREVQGILNSLNDGDAMEALFYQAILREIRLLDTLVNPR